MNLDKENFLKTYKGTAAMLMEQEESYYALFKELLQDEELLGHIRFANDVLCVPPLKSFVLYERDVLKRDVFQTKMSAVAKRGLGACFGYLYKFIYGGYDSEQCWFNDEKTGIKTASYFYKK